MAEETNKPDKLDDIALYRKGVCRGLIQIADKLYDIRLAIDNIASNQEKIDNNKDKYNISTMLFNCFLAFSLLVFNVLITVVIIKCMCNAD